MTPQHMTALAKGNQIRLARAAIKRELHDRADRVDSRRCCGEYVLANPVELATMRVSDLIATCKFTGKAAAERMLRALQISAGREVGALTDGQRVQVAVALGAGHAVIDRHPPTPPPKVERDYCAKCQEPTALIDTGHCQWCGSRLSVGPA